MFKSWQSKLLLLVVLFHLIGNLYWEVLDNTPPQFDPSNHNNISILMKSCLGDLGNSSFKECMQITPFYPPLMHLAVMPFLMISGNSIFIAQFANTIFFVLTIIAIYLWANSFWKNKSVAVFTAIAVSLMPEVYNLSRFLWQEIPVLGLTFFTLYLLSKTNHFKKSRETYVTFLFLGLAMLTKWIAAVYLFIPFAISFFIPINRESRIKILKNVAIGFMIVFAVISPWLLSNFQQFIGISKFWSMAEPGEPTSGFFSLENLLFYIKSYTRFTLGLIPAVLSLLLAYPALKGFKKYKILYLVGTVVFTYIYYTQLGNKDPRYMLALLPISWSIIFMGISKFKKIPYLLSSLIIIFYLVQYITFSYKIPINVRVESKLPIFGYVDILNLSPEFWPAIPYDSESVWPIKEIINDVIINSSNIKDRHIKFQTIVEYPKLNNQNLRLIVEKNKYNIVINDDLPMGYTEGFNSHGEAIDYLRTKDFILIPQNETSTGHYYFKPIYDDLQVAYFDTEIPKNGMQLIRIYKLPYEEINKYLQDSKPAARNWITETICQHKQCDSVYLYKVIPRSNIEDPLNSKLVFEANQYPPSEICQSDYCSFNISVPANGWVRLVGSGMTMQNIDWKYSSVKNEALVWIIVNEGSEDLEVNMNAWQGGNAVKFYQLEESGLGTMGSAIGTLKSAVFGLRTPGNCDGAGCVDVGYSVWQCVEGLCEQKYSYDPVLNNSVKLLPNHEEIYPFK